MTVRIAKIDSYEDSSRIRDFVEASIRSFTEIAAVLQKPDGPPLVVINPNWVEPSHALDPEEWETIITHPKLVLAVAEILGEMMTSGGTLCICDAPHTTTDFESVLRHGHLRREFELLQQRLSHLRVEVVDLRSETWIRKEGVVVERRQQSGDPRGYVRLDLGEDSLFYDYKGEGNYYGADYDASVVNSHHRGTKQEYLLAGSPVACDLFVSMPKLKTHRKVGVTCCLKNIVGISGNKNWLPHYVRGYPANGGDEFPARRFVRMAESLGKKWILHLARKSPRVGSYLYRKARRLGNEILGDHEATLRHGNWHGNDTCWRMVLDLHRALLYGNVDGSWRDRGNSKHYLAIVDAIVSGQGNGPICPEPAATGLLVAGCNPAITDAVACRLMGYQPEDVPLVARAFDAHRWPIGEVSLQQIAVLDERVGDVVSLSEVGSALPNGFKPHFGWPALLEGAGNAT